jgi:hypothetical protein
MSSATNKSRLLKGFFLLLVLIGSTRAQADPPTYGTLRIQDNETDIYDGASLNSNVAGSAKQGDEFTLRGDKLYNGFYKIQFGKRIAFVSGSSAQILDSQSDSGAQTGSSETKDQESSGSETRPSRDRDRASDQGDNQSPNPRNSHRKKHPTSKDSESSQDSENGDNSGQATTSGESQDQAPAGPSSESGVQRREGMIVNGSRTRSFASIPAPPGPDEVAAGVRASIEIGDAIRDAVTDARQRHIARRMAAEARAEEPKKPAVWTGLEFWRVYLGLGLGKFMPVEPAFKPNAGAGDTRAVESSSFAGLGFEIRPISFWRFFADINAHSHETKVANQGDQAYAVELPGVTTAVFPNSDVYYRMDTTTYRLGTRFTLPFRRVEPWVGGAMAWYSWKAMYTDTDKSINYGQDSGLEWGLEAHAGLDIKFGTRPLWILTLFYEYGAARVAPWMQNLGGTGSTWKDHYGTWVEAPQRVGLMFGVGW